MANSGHDTGQDITFGVPTTTALVLTTGSQFRWVCGGTGTARYAPDVPITTTSLKYPVGINQTGQMSATSVAFTVRLGGVSKVICSGSVTAFQWAKISGAASLQGGILDAAETSTTLLTASFALTGIAGQPFENGSTLQVVEMVLRPYLSGAGLA